MFFLAFSIIIVNITAYLMPKRISRQELYCATLFAGCFQLLVDLFLDVKYDLYGYFIPGVDWLSVLPIVGLYPAFNTLYCNYYPFRESVFRQAKYIAAWTAFSLAFEWASVLSGYFYYTTWKLWYSALCYPVIYLILTGNILLFRRLR